MSRKIKDGLVDSPDVVTRRAILTCESCGGPTTHRYIGTRRYRCGVSPPDDLPDQHRFACTCGSERVWGVAEPTGPRVEDWQRRGKLSIEDRIEIRRRYAAGGVTQMALARDFGVSDGRINQIVNVTDDG